MKTKKIIKYSSFILLLIFTSVFIIPISLNAQFHYNRIKTKLFPVWKVTQKTLLKNKNLIRHRDVYKKQVGHIGKWGFRNKKGRIVIEQKFDGVGYFSEGLAPVMVKGGKFRGITVDDMWGYIDSTGKFIIEPKYSDARPFSNGMAWVYEPGPGNSFIGRPYDGFNIYRRITGVYPFSEGFAAAQIAWKRWGYLNRRGKMVHGPHWQWAYPFRDGLALVVWDNYNKMAFINREGKKIIKACNRVWCLKKKFKTMMQFSQGLAPVLLWKTKKWGFIDNRGKYVIEPKYHYAGKFSQGLAPVSISDSDYCKSFGIGCKYGYINRSGEIVIDPKFDWAEPFSEGAALVIMGGDKPEFDGKRGFIDKRGRYIIKPKFSNATSFHNGYAAVKVGGKASFTSPGAWGYINKRGKFLVEPMFYKANAFINGIALVRLPGRKDGVVDISGNIALVKEEKALRDFIAGGWDRGYFDGLDY